MTRLPHVDIDGKKHLWKDILELRRTQLAGCNSSAAQLALFETLHNDQRPPVAGTAAERYQQPSLFETGL